MTDRELALIIETERAAAPGWWPVAILCTPCPAEMFGLVLSALDAALASRGYLATFRQATGLAVVWAQPRTVDTLIAPPGQMVLEVPT